MRNVAAELTDCFHCNVLEGLGKRKLPISLNNSVLNKSELMSEFLSTASEMRQSDYWQEIENCGTQSSTCIDTMFRCVCFPSLCSNFWRAS